MKITKIPRFRPYFSYTILKKIFGFVSRGNIFEGQYLQEFERAFAHYIGRKHAIALPSGRMALYLSLSALNIGEDDEIILPAYTVPEVVTMIRCAGCRVRFADIDPSTYNLSPLSVKRILSEKTRAILMTHLYGKPCDVDSLLRIAGDNNLEIIEDAAQALGAEYGGKKIGTFGRISYFSFGLVKNLNALGGGMLTTDEEVIARKVRKSIERYEYPRTFELAKRIALCTGLWCMTNPLIFAFTLYPFLYLLDFFGGISRIDEAFGEKEIALREIPASYERKFTNLQSMIGLEQLKTLDALNAKRIEHAKALQKELAGLKGLYVPSSSPNQKDIFLNLMVQCDGREEIIKKLLRKGVDTTKGYLDDCSSLSAFSEFKNGCAVARKLSKRGFYLPVNPFLPKKEIMFIAKVVKEIFTEK